MNKRILSAVIAAFAFSGVASADTVTSNLNVSATVAGACAISAAPGAMTFATYYPSFSGDLDTDAQFDVTCANLAPYTISLGNGTGVGATAAARKMTDSASANTLNYSLYTSAANRTTATPWGAGSISTTGTGAAVTYTIYGRVFGGQTTAVAGSYTDTVVVTVTF